MTIYRYQIETRDDDTHVLQFADVIEIEAENQSEADMQANRKLDRDHPWLYQQAILLSNGD